MTAVDPGEIAPAPTPSAPPDDGSPHHRQRGHRWRWIVGATVLAAVLVGVLLTVLFLVARDEPQPKSVGEAVDEFRRGDPGDDGRVAVLRPPAGVYLARGEGGERLSFPPLSGEYGADIPITVAHEADGCWLMTVDFNDAHWQTWRFCPGESAGAMVDHGGETYQRWDLGATTVENLSTFTCDPPAAVLDLAAPAGSSWTETCQGTNTDISGPTTSRGVTTYVGPEDVEIDGVSVETVHYRQERTLTGSQTGSTVTDWWFAADTGMPVASRRSADVDTPSPIGAITYTEDGSWEVRSLEPRT
jgi:hypothetical protein